MAAALIMLRRSFTMTLLVACFFRNSLNRSLLVGATSTAGSGAVCDASRKLASAATTRGGSSSSTLSSKIFRTLQVQIVHRHGDRTPITPLIDEDFWAATLVPESVLQQISSNTHLLKDPNANTHAAGGRGPFGKLTELGLLQLIKVGNKLREELVTDVDDTDDDNNTNNGIFSHVYTPDRPLTPANIRIISTNFPRTIQSVQGLLVGLFPDGTTDSIAIDARHTNIMIPDPMPRRTQEQHDLEAALASRPEILARERDMLPLAARATKALHNMLGADAHEFNFGVPQELIETEADSSIEVEPLAWNQLAEITKCLAVRDMLPVGITLQDQEEIMEHAAWRWFQSLRNPRLAHLAMHPMVFQQVDYMLQHENESEPPVTIWSAHDSTLIGLLCAYRLEQPVEWPEYGSYLMLELLEVTDAQDPSVKENVVRFSLNGTMLRSQWNGELRETIPLALLNEKIRTEGAVASSS